MNTFKLLTIGCALSAMTLGAEVIDLSAKTAWWHAGGNPTFQEGKIICPRRTHIFSKSSFAVDPAKTYTLSMDIKRLKEDAKLPSLLYGYEGLDAKGKPVPVYSYQTVPGTFTEVTAAAKKGDTVLRIKDGSKWRQSPDFYIIANAKEDFSDIPNRNFLTSGVKNIKKEGTEYVLTLTRPLKTDVAAGTKIREHLNNGYFYTSSAVKLNTDNLYRVKVVTKGLNNYGFLNRKVFPRGVPKWRIVMLINWNGSPAGIELRNPKLTIE